jgi:predicted MFS family arabinose efflux permease
VTPGPARRAAWLLAPALAVVVATEFIVVGLLPALARDLRLPLGQAGSLVAGFALAAALLGPGLTAWSGRLPPRRVLAAGLAVFALGNGLAVLFPHYPVLLAVRVAQGAVLPVFFSVGAAALVALAPAGGRGKALADANLGTVIGLVFAVPAGVLLAGGDGWRGPFLILAALAAIAGVAMALFPDTPPAPGDLRAQARLLTRPRFLAHLALSVAAFTAMFAGYTYLSAWLETVARLEPWAVALGLAGFGLAGLAGNALAGRVAERRPLAATIAAMLALALAFVLSAVWSGGLLALVGLLALWGVAHTAVFVLCQVRVVLAGGETAAFASALNISAANLGIALGAVFGGGLVAVLGLARIGLGAAVLALLTMSLAALMRRKGAEGLGETLAKPR